MNTQCVCDADGCFTDVVCRWPGATHDATIFENSRLCHRLETNELNGILLGDSAYPCCKYLLTPVLNPTSNAEKRYNADHVRTRNVIERTFGQWKQRFRCLKKLRLKLSVSQKVVVATACLHNYAKMLKIPLEEGNDNENVSNDNSNSEHNVDLDDNSCSGSIFRREIIQQYFRH